VWDVGRIDDPADKAGMHGLCFDLLDEGTATLDKNAFEEKKADIAARVSMSSSNETSAASLSVTKDRLAPAMALFSQMLTTPGLRDADLERLRARHVAGVIQSRASVDSIGSRVMGRVYWGDKHALGRVTTEKSLAAVTKKDCEAVSKRLLPDGAKLYIAGDLTAAEVQALARTHLAAWRGAGPKSLAYGSAAPLKGRYFFVHVPGAAQSRLAILQPGPLRTAPEYAANAVMMQIYGGGFSSRVNMNLREKNGYTYGARGAALYHRRGGLVSTSTSVRTDVTEASLREIAKELAGMGAPTEAELSREREGALLAFPAQFATGSSTLGAASELVFYGLPFEEWSKLVDALAKVDAKGVEGAAKRVLKPADSIVFVVGDAAVVKPALEAMAKEGVYGKGAVVELDADGNVKK
jgi:zinc protease